MEATGIVYIGFGSGSPVCGYLLAFAGVGRIGVLMRGRRVWVSRGRVGVVVAVVVVVVVGHRNCFGQRIFWARRVFFRLDLEQRSRVFWVVYLDVEVMSSNY
jgi:hypothetical protein